MAFMQSCWPRSETAQTIMTIDPQMQQGLADCVFPGGILLVHARGEIVFHRAYGMTSLQPDQKPMTCNTLFDLASLTKPLVTTAAILLLVQSGALALSDPIAKHIPDFVGRWKAQVTLFHLLNHSSGLPAHRPYARALQTHDQAGLYACVHAEPLLTVPGTQSRYSDLGFMLLGELIERISGETLDRFFDRRISQIAGCVSAGFCPDRTRMQIAATAAIHDTSIPCVHDENACVVGGVAGHAGLFATAEDTYRLARLWTDSIAGVGPFDAALALQCVTRQKHIPTSTWGLGWDTPSRVGSSSGQCFSRDSFGHLGFTGTSLWVDRPRDLMVILLTNRVYPDPENQKIKAFRPRLHDIVFKEVVGV